MKIRHWKRNSANGANGANGSSGGDNGGRVFDPDYMEQMRSRANDMSESAEEFYGISKPKKRKKRGKVKGFIKFITTPNKYKKYSAPDMTKYKGYKHPALFSGAKGGWHETKLLLKFFLLFNPTSLLLMVPLYAMYGAETSYGIYKSTPKRGYNTKYDSQKQKNYRATVLRRHEKESVEWKQEKAQYKAHKKEAKAARREHERQRIAQEAQTTNSSDSTLAHIQNEESLESILS